LTIAKYLLALNILYENQEVELKIKNTKLKEAEAEVQALRMEVLMLNSQLSTMREEKEQCKQELHKALECPKEKKKESLLKNQPPATTRRPLGMQIPLDPLEFLQDWMLRDMHVDLMMGPS
jgi:chromosome segregation ATPase